MNLGLLIKNLKIVKNINFCDVDIKGISYNSKTTQKGDLFVCIKGFVVDGHNYFQNAIDNGAIAIFSEKELPTNLPQIIVENARSSMAEIAADFYDNPSEEFNLIGVTGTNGKTTVTHLLQKILEANKEKTALIGTLGYKLSCKDEYKSEDRTTPQSLELQQLFREFSSKYKTDNVLMEVSSHALEQNRVGRCAFNGAVFTNLTQDHLDYHKTMEEYFKAKAILFEGLKEGAFAVINNDDKWADKLKKVINIGVKKTTYAIKNEADFMAKDIVYCAEGIQFVCKTPVGDYDINIKMNGKFWVYNCLAAIACAYEMGVDINIIIKTIEEIKGVSGRFETVCRKPVVIIDYAHTPDGLENALNAAKAITPKNAKLICMFGCGGDRDVTKRPLMGEIAEKICDVCVITSDNPRTENPQAIIDDILRGFVEPKKAIIEIDRGKAIEKIKEIANLSDVVLLAGKGHETYQIMADATIEFSDKKWAKKTFE